MFTGWGMSYRTPTMVVLDISMVIGFTFAPTSVSFLGHQNRLPSCSCAFSCQRAMNSLAWCWFLSDTCACNLLTIKDKLVWSSTCASSCCWFWSCFVVVVLHCLKVDTEIFLLQYDRILLLVSKDLCSSSFFTSFEWCDPKKGILIKDTLTLKWFWPKVVNVNNTCVFNEQ